MTAVAPLPTHGAVFADPRDESRSLRLSWHPELAAFVVSLWRGDRCVGTAQVPAADAPQLIGALADGLASTVPTPVVRQPA